MVATVFAFCHSPDDVRRKTGGDRRVSTHCLLPEVLQSLWECPRCPQAALAGGILGVPRAQHHPGDPSPRPPDTACAAQAGLEHPSCSPSLSSDGCGRQTGTQILGFGFGLRTWPLPGPQPPATAELSPCSSSPSQGQLGAPKPLCKSKPEFSLYFLLGKTGIGRSPSDAFLK